MNKQISDILKVALEDNLRLWDVMGQIYDLGAEDCKQQQPKGLPGVTSDRVLRCINEMNSDLLTDSIGAACYLAAWFNDPNRDAPGDEVRIATRAEAHADGVDPNRDAPAKATMHPDLEWLASLPPEWFNVPTTPGDPREPYFFKRTERCTHEGAAWVKTSTVGWSFEPTKAPDGVKTFTFAEVKQARNHLAKQKVTTPPAMSREGALEELRGFFCYEPQAYRNAIVSDMAADAKMLARALQVLAEEDQMLKAPPHVGVRKDAGGRVAEDGTPLDLNNLPDYETWFEVHGDERTVKYRPQDTREATVHELYTHFRARLLDELRQAGVIGEEL